MRLSSFMLRHFVQDVAVKWSWFPWHYGLYQMAAVSWGWVPWHYFALQMAMVSWDWFPWQYGLYQMAAVSTGWVPWHHGVYQITAIKPSWVPWIMACTRKQKWGKDEFLAITDWMRWQQWCEAVFLYYSICQMGAARWSWVPWYYGLYQMTVARWDWVPWNCGFLCEMQHWGKAGFLGITACTGCSSEVRLNSLVLRSVLPDPTTSLYKLHITTESRARTESNDNKWCVMRGCILNSAGSRLVPLAAFSSGLWVRRNFSDKLDFQERFWSNMGDHLTNTYL